MTKNPSPGFFFFFFFGGGGGEGGCRGHAGRVVDIKRMTKNPNPGFFNFGLFCEVGWVRSMARGGDGREWELLVSYVTHCIILIHIALRFHEDIL